MPIEAIAKHRDRITTLAAWHHAEWSGLFGDWSFEMAVAELRDHAERDTLPTTLVLVENGELIGSVSVVIEDAQELMDQGSPWLASLYVLPQARGLGYGRRLVQAAVQLAADNGVARLFLFTPAQESFYQRLGWQTIGPATLNKASVTVMAIIPAEAMAA